jgi:hypothetical protein
MTNQKLISRSLILLLIFLPFYSFVKFLFDLYQFFTISVILSSVRDCLILVPMLLFLRVARPSGSKYLRLASTSMTKGILFYLLVYLSGVLVTFSLGNVTLAIKAVHVSVIPVFVFLVVSGMPIVTREFIEQILLTVLVTGFSVMILSFFLHFAKPAIYLNWLAVGGNDAIAQAFDEGIYLRMRGIFTSPNTFASFMAIVSIVAFNYGSKKKRFLPSIVFWGGFIAVILSASRGGFFFAVSGIATSLMFSSKKRLLVERLFLLTLIVIALLLLISSKYSTLIEFFINRISSLFKSGEGSAFERGSDWVNVLHDFKKNVFGYGAGIGGQINLDNSISASYSSTKVIDGYYVKILAETGILGIVSVLLFLLTSGFQLIVSIRRTRKKEFNSYYVISLSLLVGFSMQSIGSNPFDFTAISSYIWLFLGISNFHVEAREPDSIGCIMSPEIKTE